MAHEIKLLQSQIDSLDLSFLENITLAHGHFQMHEIDYKVPTEIDSDNDDSTAEMTDDSVSTDESSDQNLPYSNAFCESIASHLDPRLIEENQLPRPNLLSCVPGSIAMSLKSFDTHSSTFRESIASHRDPLLIEENQSPRPNLLSCVPGPICMSLKSFDTQETERVKLEIRTVARQFRRRQQTIRNERTKSQLEVCPRQGHNLEAEIQRSNEESINVRIVREERDSKKEFLGVEKLDQPDEFIQKTYLNEIGTIRAQLDANEIRLRKLKSERNKDAALSLGMELMIARLDIVSPEVEQLILSVAALKTERRELRDRLRSVGIDDASVEASVQRQVKEREFESTRIMQELSLRVQELQNDKNELSEHTRLLRMTMGRLEASNLKLDARIEVLKSACLPITKSESDTFNKRPSLSVVSPPSRRPGAAIFRIFRRRR